MKNITKIFAGIIMISMLTACGKDESSGSMTVRIKDAPATWESVNVEIQSVEIHYSNNLPGITGWLSLDTKAGIYNLLDLQNGVTAVLSDDVIIPSGRVSQMRLITGDNNTIVIDGVTYALATNSASNTGLKINLDADIQNGRRTEVLLDFDVEKSIVIQGNGSYSLKPVLKVESIIQN